MKQALISASVLSLAAGGALAGGVERTPQSTAILFQQGRYAELIVGYLSPDVSGTVGGVVDSGNITDPYFTGSISYKQDLTENIAIAFVLDEPIGTDIAYPTNNLYPLRGTTADLESYALTGYLKYRFPSNVSVFGGVRAQAASGNVTVRTTTPLPNVVYPMETDTDYAFGYVVGVGWERPDINARVTLTYNSAITHDLESTEFGVLNGSFETTVPQSVNLEFQTGISEQYQLLLYGSVRWVDWTEFEIDPPNYPFPGRPLAFYDSDRFTYTLGLAKKFNENWAGSLSVAHEPSNGDITGNLGPTDGFTSVALGAQYTYENLTIAGILRYYWIGDATTTIGADFDGNDAIGVGVRVGYTF